MNKQLNTILTGIGSILIIMPVVGKTEHYQLHVDSRSDVEKLQGDWLQVGNDIKNSIDNYDQTEQSS